MSAQVAIGSVVDTRAVYLDVSNAEPITQRYTRSGSQFRPTALRLSYRRTDNGVWSFDGGRVSGPFLRKDGTDGRDVRDLSIWHTDASSKTLPDWITQAIADHAPQSGDRP